MSAAGIIASFGSARALAEAARQAPGAGFPHWESYGPHAVGELSDEFSPREGRSPVAWAMAIGGFCSAAGAFFMMEFATHVYPLDVGSRPLNSWPAFVPITFELGVLGAAITGVVTLFVLAGFPRLTLPAQQARGFRRASQDRFFLLLYADNPHFDGAAARAFLRRVEAETIDEVEA